MKPLFLPFPGTSVALVKSLARACGGELGALNFRRFPDGESYFRIEAHLAGRCVVMGCSLDNPDAKTTLLQLVASEARLRGAASIGLVAPYLAYMRQDASFHEGEPVTARAYAGLLSETVDWLVTVDPHLHRIHDLAEIYRIPTRTVHTTELLADWIRENVQNPILVGPDVESRQWVAAIAKRAYAPFIVLHKERIGDRKVRVTDGDLTAGAGRNAVLIDDVVSSGATLVEAAALLRRSGITVGPCVAVHSLATAKVLSMLSDHGLRLVASDSVKTAATAFTLAPILAPAVQQLLWPPGSGADLRP